MRRIGWKTRASRTKEKENKKQGVDEECRSLYIKNGVLGTRLAMSWRLN